MYHFSGPGTSVSVGFMQLLSIGQLLVVNTLQFFFILLSFQRRKIFSAAIHMCGEIHHVCTMSPQFFESSGSISNRASGTYHKYEINTAKQEVKFHLVRD